jgi:hypothetical protein
MMPRNIPEERRSHNYYLPYLSAYKTHFFHLKIYLKKKKKKKKWSASYTPKNTGNFDLSKSTLFVYIHWYVRVNRRNFANYIICYVRIP